jgi:hypothetical protein
MEHLATLIAAAAPLLVIPGEPTCKAGHPVIPLGLAAPGPGSSLRPDRGDN